MNELHYMWLKQNHNLMYVSTRMTSEQTQRIYDIYNAITGDRKKPNGCGSCMRNTVSLVRSTYEKYTQTK